MNLRQTRTARKLAAAVRAADGTPFSTQADVDALAAAFNTTSGRGAVRAGHPDDGTLYFQLGSSTLGGPDIIRGD